MPSVEEFHRSIKDDLQEIKEQVKLTNGRVQTLERWKAYITGGLAVVTILLVPILLSIANGWIGK